MVFGQQGEAFIDVHANTDPYERELERGIRLSSQDAEKVLDIIGEQWGEDLADGISKEIGQHGKEIADSVDRSVKRNKINIDGEWFTVDRHGRLHDVAGRFVDKFEREVEEGFAHLSRPGGPLSNIGQGIADAIGAGFNVSGRSPLIALLIPVFGAIAALIGGALQALNAFVALLVTLPALISAIAIQVGVLGIAFQGMGKFISAAFEAKNAKELEKALFGLEEPAKRFVRQLLPLRDFWRDLQTVVRNNFFGQLFDPISKVLSVLREPALRGFAQVATAMGSFFQSLADFFASPTFVAFVKDVFPATARWVQQFGPAFIQFLGTLIAMADLALPFLARFGTLITNNLVQISRNLQDDLKSGSFKEWLDRMADTLDLVMEVFGQFLGFVIVFLQQLDAQGGQELLRELANFFAVLKNFLASPAGERAMRGMVDALILMLQITGGVIIVFLSLFAAINLVKDALLEFFRFVGGPINDFIDKWISAFTTARVTAVQAFTSLYQPVYQAFIRVRDTIAARIEESISFIRNLPTRALAILDAAKDRFFAAGRALIQALINGMLAMSSPLGFAVTQIIGKITDRLPGSPAKEGPLSGQGYTLYRGQRMIQDLIKGMKMEMPALGTATNQAMTNINFGKGAIEIGFNGAVPTREEAERTGSAVGEGINAMLAAQRTRLAVRTL